MKRGDDWLPLRVGKRFYNGLNQLCIEVFRTQDGDIEHNFECGRPLLFFKFIEKGEETPNKAVQLADSLQNGWYQVLVQGNGLGFAKVTGNVLKNYFPNIQTFVYLFVYTAIKS